MLNQFKSEFALFKPSNRKLIFFIVVIFSAFISLDLYANNPSQKASWYRYYDKNGTANISSSVTPEHIRYGYEALDQNMQVIKKNKAYNNEKEQTLQAKQQNNAKQKEADMRLKRAYGSSKIASIKREETLKNINNQIAFQKQQYQQLEKDRLSFQKQEQVFLKKGNQVPQNLKDRLNYNAENMNNIKNNIQALQTNHRNTQLQYDNIIKRLKTLE